MKPNALPGKDKSHQSSQQIFRFALIIAVYLLLFFIFDLIAQKYEDLPGIVVWYPPAGLTYAFLLVFGIGFTPVITIAFFISSIFIYRMPQPAYILFLWALVISLTYGAAAELLRKRFHIDLELRKFRDVSLFIFTALNPFCISCGTFCFGFHLEQRNCAKRDPPCYFSLVDR